MNYRVFLDTNIYDGLNYSFHNALFERLKAYIDAGIVSLQINTVVEREVIEHINNDVLNAVKTLKKAAKHRSLTAFRNMSGFSANFWNIDEKRWVEVIVKEFQDFLSACHSEHIISNDIDVESIITAYFNRTPPFESSKPNEFKDAITIAGIIEKASTSEYEKYCVVTGDKGFQEGIKNFQQIKNEKLLIFEDLKSFISFLEVKDEEEKELLEYLKSESAEKVLDDVIKNVIKGMDFYIDGIDAEIEEIAGVNNIKYTPDIIEISDEERTALISLTVSAKVILVYSYVDEEHSFYDKEEHRYIWRKIIEVTSTYEPSFDMVVRLHLSDMWNADAESTDTGLNSQNRFIENVEIIEVPTSIDLDDEELILSLVNRDPDPYDRAGEEKDRAYTVCPDCGCPISHKNDGGNGFCIHCAPKHNN